ncbi:hypothetical protein FR265_23405 [Vibrio vulnificus]|nr:hypothetical protein [Vibrio vulnificus]
MNNVEIAYNYAKASLDNEFKTFDSLDNKANKFLGLVTLGIGIVVSLSGWGIDIFLPLSDATSCLSVFILFLLVFFLSNAWFCLFKSIKISKVPTINLNDKVIDTLLDPTTDVAKDVLCTFVKLNEAHRSVMAKKVKLLESGYTYIMLSAVSTLLLIFVIVIAKSEGLIK